MRNFKVGDIVKVKMLRNTFACVHYGQKSSIPIGTVGRIVTIDTLYYPKHMPFRVIFYIKKVDIMKRKWKTHRIYNVLDNFYDIHEIKHYFSKKELIIANEKEAKQFTENEEMYMARKLAEKI